MDLRSHSDARRTAATPHGAGQDNLFEGREVGFSVVPITVPIAGLPARGRIG